MRIVIKRKDLIRKTFRSGGPGGQRGNKVETGVRYTHIPTGIVGESRIHETQGKNDAEAIRLLLRKIKDKYEQERREQGQGAYAAKQDAAFGRQIRSYYLSGHQRVIDHRSGSEHPSPSSVLDGELDCFLIGCLRNSRDS